MNDVDRNRAGAAKAHKEVVATLQTLTDDQVTQPSLLPGWTVGHVATHIARNAEGHMRMLDGAKRDEVLPMYPGGTQQRAEDIEAGSRRSAAELLADVAGTAAELEATWADLPARAWSRHGVALGGEISMADLLFIRWREVCVHHADLGLGYTWADWDDEYVRVELIRLTMQWASRKPMGMTELPREALAVSPRRRVAWLLGRTEIDGLPEAGITN
ncbi:MAG TPA: maleylpyruvate isomerase N-terminal domain-containing protein [Ilumatobacteraceae bacterium]|nr:maleylpyruvate isomerase N-terminal domain-containing protein [Ilumatobacteraceae bacterium]